MQQRSGESQNYWLRTHRIYQLIDQWYFSTREGIDFGPFANLEEANKAVQQYIDENKKD